MKDKIVILAVSVSFFVGCSKENATPADGPKKPETVNFMPLAQSAGTVLKHLTEEEKAEFVKHRMEFEKIMDELERGIERAGDWKRAHEEISKILETNSKHRFADELQQVAANRMLHEHLLKQQSDTDTRQAIGFYVTLLLQNEHPDSHIILQALERLRGEWSEVQIRVAAQRTLKAAEAYLEKNPCCPCLEETGMVHQLLDARETKFMQMMRALPALQKFAAGESQ